MACHFCNQEVKMSGPDIEPFLLNEKTKGLFSHTRCYEKHIGPAPELPPDIEEKFRKHLD